MEALHRATVRRGDKIFTISHSDPLDHIFRQIQDTSHFYERDFLEALAVHLRPGDLVVDVGANIGNHSVFFAGVCGCEVIAIEPSPQAADLLRTNIRENHLDDRVQVVQAALGAAQNRASIQLDDGAHNLGAGKLLLGSGDVQVMMLDELVAARSPKLIKIDVEGGDLDVLKGARSVIARDAPIVCVEAAGAREFCDIADFLQTFGMAPVATYNYTPTHVFRAWNYEGDQSMLASIAVSTGLLYIRHYELRKILHTRLQSLTDKILSVEANVASAPHRKPRKREKGRGVRGA